MSLHGVVANVQDCYILLSEFELHSCYNIDLPINILEKGIDPFIPLALAWIVPLLFVLQQGFK